MAVAAELAMGVERVREEEGEDREVGVDQEEGETEQGMIMSLVPGRIRIFTP